MTGANAPASLASRPIRVVLCDEVDRYPHSAGSEGDPVSLASKRATTFWNRKIVLTSTPTIKGVSRIEYEYEQSDKRRYHVPCHECGQAQTLNWSNVQWDKDEAGNHLPDTARYVCDHCGVLWEEKHRLAATRKGEWIADNPGGNRAGFHLSELYSPWSALSDMVRGFIDASGNTEQLKTWVNTTLGESWEDRGDQVDQNSLYARREDYEADVPGDALIITAGIDVQRDRIEVEVVAWGEGEESWNVDYRVIPGDTARDEVWQDLENALSADYQHATGTALHITAAVIDSGDQTTRVYEFVRQSRHQRLFAGKGVSGAGRPVAQISRRQSGQNRRQVDLYALGVDDAKGTLYARLKMSEPGPGYCHFPLDRDVEYFEQLTAEKLVTKFHKGFPRKEWVKTRPRNEALDCRVYAYAALKILNPVWSAVSRKFTQDPKKQTENPRRPIDTLKSRPAAKPGRRRSGWVSKY